ncbi:hypothetical protein KY290_007255 [Solanum tuberosum]|uniref:Integrase catalytic domain-containing protein n=1 Tax=Solanum tuberosum TaxID=4113 RepID=A0ABQ7W702_SOLTU|nr:hypothetical protein KY290_007255 [Solanum tuberosum]
MENYSLWSRSMLINLRAKSKVGFVLGTCKRSNYKLELEEQWEKCNCFVLAWIMNTVSKELLSGIVYADDAVTMWSDLKERFDKGHVKLDCFKLNGYPPDWKFKKKQPENFGSSYDQNGTGQMQRMKANQVRVDQGIMQDEFAPICRKEEVQGVRSQEKILHMLDKEEAGTSGINMAANMAGIPGHYFYNIDLSNEKVKGISKEVDGLYYLPSQTPHGEGKSNEMILMTHNSENLNNTLLWHNRLGHPSARVLQQLSLTSDIVDDMFGDLTKWQLIMFNKHIQRIRSDNGGEFFNKDCDDFLVSHGIIHESSCPYTPQ